MYRQQFLEYLDRYDDIGSSSTTQVPHTPLQQSAEDEWFRRPAIAIYSTPSSFSTYSQSSAPPDSCEELTLTRQEGEAYLSTPCVRQIANFDLLDWWRVNATTYPRLASVARDILAVPITEVGVERVFNTARDIIGDRRHRLSAQTIRQIMILKDSIALEQRQEEDLPPTNEVDDLLELPACPSPEAEITEARLSGSSTEEEAPVTPSRRQPRPRKRARPSRYCDN
jgi:hypothetical protein